MIHLIIAEYNKAAVALIEKEVKKKLNPYELGRIDKYKDQKKDQKIIGFELLQRQLDYFNQNISLYDLKRSQFHQPYFESTAFQFSLSYSNNFVICLASLITPLGVDIALEDATLINVESELLNKKEKENLVLNNNAKHFFFLHTRKEAISKALGLGIYLDYSSIDVQSNELRHQNKNWFLNTLTENNYAISCATAIEHTEIHISKIEF